MVRRTPHENRAKNANSDGPVGAPKASYIKEVLVTLRDRLEAHLANGDGGESGTLLNLRENMRDQLKQISEALIRIEEDKYGVCANCLSPIAAERLVARPYSTLCTDCQNRRERENIGEIEQPRHDEFRAQENG
jgi:RNA polymerase-binding transcription factor DksA